ncbi:hypothetical protein QQ045_003398 [Rhodiola kirilowii]
MGPLNTNYQAAEPAAAEGAAAINHFAHHHPLHLSHHHHQQTPCSACSHPTTTPAYGCQHCNFYLHISCSKMPQQLKHPFDSNKTHALTLLQKPVYHEGRFSCDACGHPGSGFSYHCSDCRIDLHILCAGLPTVASVSSHEHQLSLVFAPPYENNQFMCDVCVKAGSKTWLYHCRTCLFDVHLGCARGAQNPVRSVSLPTSYQQPNAAFNQGQPVMRQSSYPQPNTAFNQGQGHPVMGQPANPMPYSPARSGPQIGNAMFKGAVEELASVMAQNVTNVVLGGFFNGGSAIDCTGGGGVEEGSGGGEF